MIRHSMDIVKAAVQIVNPGQIPILAEDQPLYAIAMEIQWTWPATHGEDHFVIMFGGLHIEMAMLTLLGDWLEDSCWRNALIQANIASSGTANSFIHASHVTKVRHTHQVKLQACMYTPSRSLLWRQSFQWCHTRRYPFLWWVVQTTCKDMHSIWSLA